MQETSEPDVIWTATLEDRFVCAVKRTGERTGFLLVMDKTTEQPVFSKDVGLSYGPHSDPTWMTCRTGRKRLWRNWRRRDW
jgi:hypothetical protein